MESLTGDAKKVNIAENPIALMGLQIRSGLAWMVDTLPKKESFQFSFSYKISMNVILELPNYSVLGCAFLVGHSPFLVLLEWGKLDGEFVWTCYQKRIFSVLFLIQNFHECNLNALAPLLSTTRLFLVGHSPFLVLLEWEKLDGEFAGRC